MNPRLRLACDPRGALAVALLLLGAAATAGAEKQASPPESREILKRMSDVLASARQLSFHAELSFDESPIPGLIVQLAGAVDVALRRSDGLRLAYRDDLGARTLWYDGKTLTLLDWGAGVAASAKAPGGVDRAMARLTKDYGLSLPLAELLASDPYEALLARSVRGTSLGIHDVEGVPCHHLAFLKDDVDWEIWVDAGRVPVPRKLLIRYKREPGSPQYVAVLMDWELDAKLPEDRFRAALPEQVVAVDFLEATEGTR